MIAMMPQVQLRSFCSEEVWHPRSEVLRKFLSMAQVVESRAYQNKMISGGLSKVDIGYCFLLLIFFRVVSFGSL